MPVVLGGWGGVQSCTTWISDYQTEPLTQEAAQQVRQYTDGLFRINERETRSSLTEYGDLERGLVLNPPSGNNHTCAPPPVLVAVFTNCLVSLLNNLQQKSPLWYLQVPTRCDSVPTLTSNPGPRINHDDGDVARPAGQSERRNEPTG